VSGGATGRAGERPGKSGRGRLGADEGGGEPGREEDRDGIEPQARVGAVLLDIGGGELGCRFRGFLGTRDVGFLWFPWQ
jgi:hypothetical protein